MEQRGSLTFTDSGRSAIRLALRSLHLSPHAITLAPAYLCDTVHKAVVDAGLKVALYPVNLDLSVSLSEWETLPDVALVVGYFGFAPDMSLANRLQAAGVPVIFDLTQSLLSEHALEAVCDQATRHGSLVIASLRKLLPLPDGGLVWAPHTFRNDIDRPCGTAPHSKIRMRAMNDKQQAHKQEQGQLSGNKQLNNTHLDTTHPSLFLAAEELLNTQEKAYAISDVSQRLMHQLDLNAIKERRRRNYLRLLQQSVKWAPHIAPLFSSLPDNVCPLGFPIIATSLRYRDELTQRLRQHGITTQVHWPLTPKAALCSPCARYLSMRMLTLPCDQRYSDADMIYIGRVIVAAIQEWRNMHRQ